MNITDLTTQAPRSPKALLGGYVLLARSIDKCRATLAGKAGEYEFDCELDNVLFDFKGIKGDDLKAYIAEGHTDEEIVAWMDSHGIQKGPAEIAEWNRDVLAENYSDDPEGKEWLEGKNKHLGLEKDGTLLDYLEADDIASFKK